MKTTHWVYLALFSWATPIAIAAPPTDPEARKVYDHNYNWLKSANTNFIAINIRGANDQQYPERRQAALDLLREKRDLTTVPDLMDELQRGSFLSAQICDILGDWHAKKALPLLEKVVADKARPKEVREGATKAIQAILKPVPETPRPSY